MCIQAFPKRAGRVQRQCREATVSIEFALLLPLLILLLLGLIDLGSIGYESMQVQTAAEAGAQYAVRYGWNVAAIANAVTGATNTDGVTATPAPNQFCACPTTGLLTPVACASVCPDGKPPSTYAAVSAQLQFTTVLSYPGLANPVTLSATARRRLQ